MTKDKIHALRKNKCKLLPAYNNVHQFSELSKPIEITKSVVELTKPRVAPQLSQLEEIKDKPDLHHNVSQVRKPVRQYWRRIRHQ